MITAIVSALFGLIKRIITGILVGIINNPAASCVMFVAFVGGVAASDTFIGDLFGGFLGWFPPEVAVAAFGLLAIGIAWDCAKEGVPEAIAILGAFTLPSVALGIPEKAPAHKQLSGWMTDLNTWLDVHIGDYLSGGAKEFTATCISLFAVGLIAMWLLKYGKGRYGTRGATTGTTGATAGATTTTTTSPVQQRRRAAR